MGLCEKTFSTAIEANVYIGLSEPLKGYATLVAAYNMRNPYTLNPLAPATSVNLTWRLPYRGCHTQAFRTGIDYNGEGEEGCPPII